MDALQQHSQHEVMTVIGSPFHPEDKEAAYLFNQAHDKISEVQHRLQFLYESSPMTSTVSSFSSDGLQGMCWLVGDMIHTLAEARELLKNLIKYEQRLDAEADQHGPTSFTMGV